MNRYKYNGHPYNNQGDQVEKNKNDIESLDKKLRKIESGIGDVDLSTLPGKVTELEREIGKADTTRVQVEIIKPEDVVDKKVFFWKEDGRIFEFSATPDNGVDIVRNSKYLAQIGAYVLVEGDDIYIAFDDAPARNVYITAKATAKLGGE